MGKPVLVFKQYTILCLAVSGECFSEPKESVKSRKRTPRLRDAPR